MQKCAYGNIVIERLRGIKRLTDMCRVLKGQRSTINGRISSNKSYGKGAVPFKEGKNLNLQFKRYALGQKFRHFNHAVADITQN